jgi:hypothetical protein
MPRKERATPEEKFDAAFKSNLTRRNVDARVAGRVARIYSDFYASLSKGLGISEVEPVLNALVSSHAALAAALEGNPLARHAGPPEDFAKLQKVRDALVARGVHPEEAVAHINATPPGKLSADAAVREILEKRARLFRRRE